MDAINVSQYLPLARTLAPHYVIPGLDLEELVQEGMYHLQRQAQRSWPYEWTKALVVTILRNHYRIVRRNRLRRADDTTGADFDNIPASVPSPDELLAVQGYLRDLSRFCTPKQRDVLRYLLDPRDVVSPPQKAHIRESGEHSPRSVAEGLGIGLEAAKHRLHSLREKASALAQEHLLSQS